jgi:hypothetical protein
VRRRGVTLRRHLGAFLGMLALLFQMGVPLAHDPVGLGALAPWLGVALCRAGGAADPSHAPAAPGKSAVCPICLGLATSADLVSPPAVAGIAIAALPLPLQPPPGIAPRRHDRGGPAQPRGPPSLA